MTAFRRNAAVLAVASVVFVALAAVPLGGLAASSTAYVSVAGVTVAPTQPAPGDLVTVSATVQNLPSSASPLTVDKVVLEHRTGIDVASESDLGTLSPGASIQVPLTTSFAKAGTQRLRVTVYGTDDAGNQVEVHYPVVVRVTDAHPQLDVSVPDAVANADSTATVTVTNGLQSEVRNLDVTLDAPDVSVTPTRRVRATLPAGATANVSFTVDASTPGDHQLNATLTYATPDGTRRTVHRNLTAAFDPLRDDVAVTATPTNGGTALAVRVTNRGNAPVSNVTVSADAPNATFTTAFLPPVPAKASRTALVNVTSITADTAATVRASYDVGDRHRSVTTTANVTANPAAVTVTGLDVQQEDGKYHVTGSASNVGLAPASSVIVRVLPAEGVQPAYPGRQYFVGTVPASDFVTFDVYATVSENATSIPLEVTYLADGRQRSRTFSVPLDATGRTTPTGGSGGGSSGGSALGGWLVPGLVGLVVVVLVAAAVALAWRNSRGRR